jgi:hypothetical protein
MSTSSRALPMCPPGPPEYSAAPQSSDERLWAVRPLGQPTGRLPRGWSRARIGPGATISYHRSSITPTFVTDGTLIDGLKLELRRSEYRFAARVPGGTLWLRSAPPTTGTSAA